MVSQIVSINVKDLTPENLHEYCLMATFIRVDENGVPTNSSNIIAFSIITARLKDGILRFDPEPFQTFKFKYSIDRIKERSIRFLKKQFVEDVKRDFRGMEILHSDHMKQRVFKKIS